MSASSSLQFPRFTTLADSAPPRRPRPAPRWSSRRDQRKSPAKRRAGPAFGYAGDGLPSRCIRRYRLPSRCTRQKFHARPEQGNGPAADGASFSLTLKFIGVRKEPLFPSGTKTNSGLGESFRPLSSPASVNCVRAEGLSRLTSLLRETRLRGWACRTRSAPGDRQGVGGASPLR